MDASSNKNSGQFTYTPTVKRVLKKLGRQPTCASLVAETILTSYPEYLKRKHVSFPQTSELRNADEWLNSAVSMFEEQAILKYGDEFRRRNINQSNKESDSTQFHGRLFLSGLVLSESGLNEGGRLIFYSVIANM